MVDRSHQRAAQVSEVTKVVFWYFLTLALGDAAITCIVVLLCLPASIQ